MSVRLEGVEKRFGETRAVAGVDLDLREGELVAVLGPSGCGKTTLLRLIAGFETPDAGTIAVGGELVAGAGRSVPPERRRIGMVFQDYALFPHLRVEANVAFGLARRSAADRRALTRDTLALVGLEQKADRYPHELSGGEQQRVALARALAPQPEIVLLDEPFSSLDATLRAGLRRDVETILREAAATALLVTHDQEEALSLADRVAVMRDGRIQQEGTPEDLYDHPATRWVAEFLGDAEILPGDVTGDVVRCDLGTFPAPGVAAGAADVIVRPESITVSPVPDGPVPADGVRARVVHRTFFGHDHILHLELAGGRAITTRGRGSERWKDGQPVVVRVDGPVTVLPAG